MNMKQRIHKKRICIAVHKSSSSTEGCDKTLFQTASG